MIIVIGSPVGRLLDEGVVVAAGTAARAALAAASAGRSVQLVGRTGDDPVADALLLSLSRGGVGHAALLRDPARATPVEAQIDIDDGDLVPLDDQQVAPPEPLERPTLDAADVQLALRYLSEFAVLVLAEPARADVIEVVGDAARWNGAQLLLVVGPNTVPADGLPPDAIVFEAPEDDLDGVFATLVGTFAAALDDGADPAEAFQSSLQAEGWTVSAPD